MNLKALKTLATSKVGRRVLIAQKNSPRLLFVVGVVGVVGTVVLASRATLKLEEVLEEAQENLEKARGLEHPDYSEQDRKKDMAIIYTRTVFKVARMYAPAIAVGAVAVTALTGSHIILTRRNVGLTAAYAALDKGFREYRTRIVGELGEEKERELRYNLQERTIVEETNEGPITKTVKDVHPKTGSIYARCFDEFSVNWSPDPGMNQMFLQCQQNWANDMLKARGHLFLNEVHDMLGLARTSAGQVVGWVMGNGDSYVDFGIFRDRNVRDGSSMNFILGRHESIWLDFNVDGVVHNLIEKQICLGDA